MLTVSPSIFLSLCPPNQIQNKPNFKTTPIFINKTLTPISKLLASCTNIIEFAPIHAQLITTNLIHEPQVISQVFTFLISVNELSYAYKICQYAHHSQQTIIWNSLLETQLKEGSSYLQVLVTYKSMVSHGVVFNLSTFHFLIHACCKGFDLRIGEEVHGRILKSEFGRNKCLNNNLMGFYSKCLKSEKAYKVFDKMPHRDVISWNTMISCYVNVGMYRDALVLFDEMLVSGVTPDEVTMISLASACGKLKDLESGKRLHDYIKENGLRVIGSLLNSLVDMYVKYGKLDEAQRLCNQSDDFCADVVLSTTMVSGYVKCKKIEEARKLFDQMRERSLISWTTMMSGYVQGGHYLESLKLFREMRLVDVTPDEVALVTALSACARVGDFELGKAFHGLIVRYGMIVDGFLGNALMDLYAKYGTLEEAHMIFEQLPNKSIVSWNSMLYCFCKSGDIDEATNFFSGIPGKDVVSWNTLLNFYITNDFLNESFVLFGQMQSSGVKPDKLTLISLLSACANVGALSHGIWVHTYIERNRFDLDTMLGTALIDLYSNCGCIELAYQIFAKITDKNVFIWTAMIKAYAMEGNGGKAIDLFLQMEREGIKPDYITFVALLSACSHGGLVQEGYDFFNKMRNFYSITPRIQHYGCMVDLLGRSGRLEEALNFIKTMPIEPDACIWSSLMRASGIHNRVELAEYASQHIIEKEEVNDGAYVLLSNIYAKAGKWEDISRLRKTLHDTGVRKQPGFTLIESKGILHRFTSGDRIILQNTEIRSTLEEIDKKLLESGQLPQQNSGQHSERLAVAYGLINNYGNSPIRVVNNVRICGDCHQAMKLISHDYNTEIVVRDNFRFHRFKNGNCSCKDFW